MGFKYLIEQVNLPIYKQSSLSSERCQKDCELHSDIDTTLEIFISLQIE